MSVNLNAKNHIGCNRLLHQPIFSV